MQKVHLQSNGQEKWNTTETLEHKDLKNVPTAAVKNVLSHFLPLIK